MGPIVKWHYAAFALPRRESDSPWVHQTGNCKQGAVAERSEAASNSLRFFKMWTILIVRTVFAACGGEESPPRQSKIAASQCR